jgi:tetratricopeptide (TPR) repeat protein
MRSRSAPRLAQRVALSARAATVALLLSGACALAPDVRAQSHAQAQGTDPYSRAEALELASKFADAAAAYSEALTHDPANLPALLGLERMDAQLGHLDQFLPVVERAITAKPQLAPIREAQLRTLRSLGKRDQLREAFERWRHDAPGDPTPAREYSRLLIADGDTRAADSVLRQAQRDVGTGRGFEYELAQLRAATGLWDLAAQSWREAVEDNGYLDQAATFSLVSAPVSSRAGIIKALQASPVTVSARRVLASLQLMWGTPRDGWESLRVLNPDSTAVVAWGEFATKAEEVGAWLVARDALAAAQHSSPEPRALARAAYDALRGGDATGSLFLATLGERTLDSATAAATIVPVHMRALSQTGRVAEASQVMNAYSRFLRPADRAPLDRVLAWGWIRAGDITKARDLLAHSDSSDADALGWLALYDGNLAAARKSLRPEVESSPEALAALALLARTRADTAPVTGRAFLALARGDTAGAATGFERAAAELGDAAPLLLATAARLYAAHHSEQQAIALWSAIVTKSGDSPEAPEAELDWARALRHGGQNKASIEHLEHLILTYPQSALLPQARRELELSRNGIAPQS